MIYRSPSAPSHVSFRGITPDALEMTQVGAH
jgi:hypothetical protein